MAGVTVVMVAERCEFHFALDFGERCREALSVRDVRGAFNKVLRSLGVTRAIAAEMPAPGAHIGDKLLSEHWPRGLLDTYNQRNYSQADPICEYARRNFFPFFWSSVPADFFHNPLSERLMEEARAFGVADALCVPVRVAPQRNYFVHFQFQNASDTLIVKLHYVAHSVCAALMRVSDGSRKTLLTRRETECLEWVARGKSAWETSVIIGIGEPTVRSHLVSVRAKLDANTTSQAVAIALRTGIID